VSDKTRKAIGIKYNSGEAGAKPKVVSKGFGDLAQAIIQQAEEAGVLIHEDPYLTDMLSTLDLGQEIPESLYYVIAELIAFSYVLQGKIPAGWEDSGHLPQRV